LKIALYVSTLIKKKKDTNHIRKKLEVVKLSFLVFSTKHINLKILTLNYQEPNNLLLTLCTGHMKSSATVVVALVQINSLKFKWQYAINQMINLTFPFILKSHYSLVLHLFIKVSQRITYFFVLKYSSLFTCKKCLFIAAKSPDVAAKSKVLVLSPRST